VWEKEKMLVNEKGRKKMKSKTKVVRVMLVSIFLGVMMVNVQAQGVTISVADFIGGAAEVEVFEYLEQQFQERNPGVKVERRYTPFAEYTDVLTTSIVGGSPPDVAMLYDFNAGKFIGMGAILALDDLIKRDYPNVAQWEADWAPGMLTRENGKIHMLCIRGGPRCVFYNVDRFRSVGLYYPARTWEEFVQDCKKLTRDINGDGRIDEYGIGLAATKQGEGMWDWFSVLTAWGGKLLNEDRTAAFNQSEAIESMQFYVDLLLKHKVVPPGVLQTPKHKEVEEFIAGLTSMTWYGPWFISTLKTRKPKFKWAVGLMPTHEGRMGSSVGPIWWGICKTSKHHEEAWEFIKFMTGPEASRYMAKKLEYTPARLSVLNDPELQKMEHFRVFVEQAKLPGAYIIPMIPETPQLIDILVEAYQTAMSGRKTAKEALDKAAAKWNRLIAR